MSMGRYGWPIIEGDDEVLVITFEGMDYDAGRQWDAQVRRHRSITAELLADTHIEASADDDGYEKIVVSLTDEQTRLIGVKAGPKAWWDLQLTESSTTTTILGGEVEVVRDVTL